MRTSSILTLGLAALATSTPLHTRDINNLAFDVTNFVFGCTETCDYSFDVSTSGMAKNYHNVTTPVSCSGTAPGTDYVECSATTNKMQTISAYITKGNMLKLEYVYSMPKQDVAYYYYGHKMVRSATGGKATKPEFVVPITSASS